MSTEGGSILTRSDRLRRLLREHRSAVGTWLVVGSLSGAKSLAYQGFDWLGVGQTCRPVDVVTSYQVLQAIRTTKLSSFVGMSLRGIASYRQPIYSGSSGVFVSDVATREEAVGAVQDV